MSDHFDELQRVSQTQGPNAALEHLITTLRGEQRFHPLFDAMLLKRKFELGLPLTRPSSFDDVPAEKRDEFEKTFVAAAREVGQAFLADKSIPQAWMYFRTIRETEPISQALEALPDDTTDDQLLDIAFYQGANPPKGLKFMLGSHGTCSSITALDQQFGQLKPEARVACAGIIVKHLYDALRETLESEVRKRQPMLPPKTSLKELISGRDWLFAEDAYHIDVSHLHSVVRFARMLGPKSPELPLALQLAQYGTHLAENYQYAGSHPFEEYYPAHIHYFKALLGQETEAGVQYFRDKIGQYPDENDKQVAAFTLVDLLLRLERHAEALDVISTHLVDSADDFGLSLPDLCVQTGRHDLMQKLARDKQDLVTFASSLIAGRK